MKEEKPELLYIDRHPGFWIDNDTGNGVGYKIAKEYHKRQIKVLMNLSKIVYPDIHYDLLSLDVSDLKRYDFLLTHLQEDPDLIVFDYQKSIDRIKELHNNYPDLKIIIYTGAMRYVVEDYLLQEAGAYKIMRKKDIQRLDEDIEEIMSTLEDLLRE